MQMHANKFKKKLICNKYEIVQIPIQPLLYAL